MKDTVIVLDLGTTNSKTTLFDAEGSTVAQSSCPTPVVYAGERMEVEPEKLWENIRHITRSMLRETPDTFVKAIVISSMASTLIPLDAAGSPLYNAISWSDMRTKEYCDDYMSRFVQGFHIADCGQYPLTQYSGFKLQWLRDHEPGIYGKTKKWVNISEFIYHKLTGEEEFYTDYSIASRNMLFDVKKRKWNPAALDYFDVDPEWLAEPRQSGTVIGYAAPAIRGGGVTEKTAIVLGGHDHMCSFLGAGITKPGIILNSTGTSEAVECLLSDVGRPEDYAGRWINLENSVLPGRTAAVCYVTATGRVYQSISRSVKDADLAYSVPPSAEPLFIPPERAMLSTIRGELRGISTVFDGPALMRAVMDGMYFECRRDIERIQGVDQTGDVILRCVGGAAGDPHEMQCRSDALGHTIEACGEYNASAAGAFLLGAFGCGMVKDLEESAKSIYGKAKKTVYVPDRERKEQYTQIYREHYLPCFPEGVQSL